MQTVFTDSERDDFGADTEPRATPASRNLCKPGLSEGASASYDARLNKCAEIEDATQEAGDAAPETKGADAGPQATPGASRNLRKRGLSDGASASSGARLKNKCAKMEDETQEAEHVAPEAKRETGTSLVTQLPRAWRRSSVLEYFKKSSDLSFEEMRDRILLSLPFLCSVSKLDGKETPQGGWKLTTVAPSPAYEVAVKNRLWVFVDRPDHEEVGAEFTSILLKLTPLRELDRVVPCTVNTAGEDAVFTNIPENLWPASWEHLKNKQRNTWFQFVP